MHAKALNLGLRSLHKAKEGGWFQTTKESEESASKGELGPQCVQRAHTWNANW
jgi:predicted cupin superfamily sugar epimerase